MTLAAGQRLHMRTDGRCRWGSIWLPTAELVRYGSALTGGTVTVPSAADGGFGRRCSGICAISIRLAFEQPKVRRTYLFGDEAAHGLKQQLIEALVERLSNGSIIEATRAIRGRQDVAVRFEALLQARPARA
jgi:hypothetical protein